MICALSLLPATVSGFVVVPSSTVDSSLFASSTNRLSWLQPAVWDSSVLSHHPSKKRGFPLLLEQQHQLQHSSNRPKNSWCTTQPTTMLHARRKRTVEEFDDDEDDDDIVLREDDDNDRDEEADDGEDDDDFAADEDDDEDAERDVPDDWSEDDILAAVGDVVAVDDDVDVDVVVDDDVDDVDSSRVNLRARNDEDEDAGEVDEDDGMIDDEDDLDDVLELNLDDEDDEEDEDDGEIVEEVLGKQQDLYDDDADDAEEEDDEKVIASGGYADDDDEEWDEDDDGGNYELEDDPNDPDTIKQKELVEEAIAASQQRARDEDFDALDFVQNQLSERDADELDQLPFMREVQERMKAFQMISESDFTNKDLDDEMAKTTDIMEDPYPRHGPGEMNFLQKSIGLSDDDMEQIDNSYKEIDRALEEEPWDKVMLKDWTGWEGLTNETVEEMEAALEEIDGSAYNVTRWLLYDQDFNVSNLILAAIKHNREAPILFQHWYPQLVTYKRYQHARDRNFDFNWDDVEKADISELERYYAGFGYDEIPQKAPAETGIISFEELDEEEIKMAAFENWVTRVYNPEIDRTDFDDDDMRDEDNVFSEFYEAPQHPDLPTFEDAEDDIDQWNAEMGDDPEIREYRDMMGQKFEYEVVEDEEFDKAFRGHLIVACTGMTEDLDIAEKITKRFEKEFGKQVFVETRVMALAREEDNVFEVWLESYEIDLLHSKKRATSNTVDWRGPAECDDEQIDYLVERVRFLISDDARYSYRMEADFAV